jgi:nitric oxide reductase NorQ protein
MSNPVVYFSVAKIDVKGKTKHYLCPLRSNAVLTKRFSETDVIIENIAFYNRYTTKFIAAHVGSNDYFYSDDYEYNPDLCTFNFNVLNICTDADWEKMQYDTGFDASKKYEFAKGEKTLTLLERIREEHPCPPIETGFYVEPRIWEFLVRNIIQHKNTMLIGPTGTGKTEIIMKICETLGLDCHIYDMGSMQDPLTDLLGSHRLENGSSVFDYAKFVEDVQKPGVILLDELSRAPLMTNNILFPCLDVRRQLPIEIADSKHDRVVKVHPECVFIATANIGSEYSGTNEIDAALLNRFLPLQLNYLPANIEIEILKIRTGVDTTIASEVVSKFNTIRIAYNENRLSKSVSTRELIACGELIADGFSVNDAIDFVVCQKFLNSSYESELTTVKRILSNL